MCESPCDAVYLSSFPTPPWGSGEAPWSPAPACQAEALHKVVSGTQKPLLALRGPTACPGWRFSTGTGLFPWGRLAVSENTFDRKIHVCVYTYTLTYVHYKYYLYKECLVQRTNKKYTFYCEFHI